MEIIHIDDPDVKNIIESYWSLEHQEYLRSATESQQFPISEVCQEFLHLIKSSKGSVDQLSTKIRKFIGATPI